MKDEGRSFPNPVRSQAAVDNLIIPDPEETMPFVMETIKLLRAELKVPLIGFSGAPFTLATYLIEGGSSKVFLETKRMIFQAPEMYHDLLQQNYRLYEPLSTGTGHSRCPGSADL